MTLGALISDSKLSQEDKDLWFSVLEKSDETQIKIYEDLLEGKEENLVELTENLKAKIRAFKNLDEKTLEQILNQEQHAWTT